MLTPTIYVWPSCLHGAAQPPKPELVSREGNIRYINFLHNYMDKYFNSFAKNTKIRKSFLHDY